MDYTTIKSKSLDALKGYLSHCHSYTVQLTNECVVSTWIFWHTSLWTR